MRRVVRGGLRLRRRPIALVAGAARLFCGATAVPLLLRRRCGAAAFAAPLLVDAARVDEEGRRPSRRVVFAADVGTAASM